jgi:hypothetical protein
MGKLFTMPLGEILRISGGGTDEVMAIHKPKI